MSTMETEKQPIIKKETSELIMVITRKLMSMGSEHYKNPIP